MRRAVLPLLFLLLAGAAAGVSFAVVQQGDWNRGTFSGTTATNGALQVASGQSSGTYTADTFDGGDNYTWDTLRIQTDLNGGSATVTVETSHDGFATVRQRSTHTAGGGTEAFNLSSLNETQYVRFNYSLSGDAAVNSTNITIGDASTFIIRNETCQADERELFSMSNRTNAHAGDPGYWQHPVCASGFDQRHFTEICASDETAILSFFGSEQNDSHLATDPALFGHKLCTETLTIGVRDTCPDSTRAIVSIFEEDQDHIAEPGHYPKQLCGAFFDSVTAMLRFHLGQDAVYINRTADPDEGIYRDLAGRASWSITAQNGTFVAGIVSGERTTTTSAGFDTRGGDRVFNMTQERGKAGYFLPFAVGTTGDIRDRIPLIEDATFLDEINPNFGFALAEEMTVRLTLELTDIDLIGGLDLSPGSHRLLIEKRGETGDGTPKVSVNATE